MSKIAIIDKYLLKNNKISCNLALMYDEIWGIII